MHYRTLHVPTILALGALALGACHYNGSDPSKAPVYTPPTTTPYTPPAPTPEDRKFVILHTNDEHSHIMGFGPESQYPYLPKLKMGTDAHGNPAHVYDAEATPAAWALALATHADQKTVGGMVRRQYLVNKIRASSSDPVLLVSAGDSMMGTLMHLAASSAAPDQVLMALLGYDFMTIGNHDFDWGPDNFAATIAAAKRVTLGATVPYVSSNIHFGDVKDTGAGTGSSLEALAGDANSGAPIVPWAVKMLPNGLKVGFMGLLGVEASVEAVSLGEIRFSVAHGTTACTADADCASEAGTKCLLGTCAAPFTPTNPTPTFAGLFADAQKTIDTLRNDQKVDVVVLLSHLGISEETALAANVTGLDVIIGGHSHTLQAPEKLDGKDGAKVIYAQAGDYGRDLGELAIVVHPDGTVDFDAAESKLNPIDFNLDAEIYGDTDLTANPPVVSDAMKEALALTQGVVGPVAGGLTDNLAAALGAFVKPGAGLWDPMVASDHDVLGPTKPEDSSLSHMETDAMQTIAAAFACKGTDNVIAVQANGVLRDDLLVGLPTVTPPDMTAGTVKSASFADVFRVDPLGASPFEDTSETGPKKFAPGFPLVLFQLTGIQLMAGLEVGVTQGLASDSFFLSYKGATVTYSTDQTRSAFDPKKLATGAYPGGHVVKLTIGTNVVYDESRHTASDTAADWLARWQGVDLSATTPTLFTIVTNLYIAGFLDAFGLVPVTGAFGQPITDTMSREERLMNLVLCQVPGQPAPDCLGGHPSVDACVKFPLTANHQWTVAEEKEWQALMTYLAHVVPNKDLSPMYKGISDTEPSRVAPAQ